MVTTTASKRSTLPINRILNLDTSLFLVVRSTVFDTCAFIQQIRCVKITKDVHLTVSPGSGFVAQ